MMYSAKVKTPLITLLVVCLAAGSLVALAAEPESVTPENSGQADPTRDAETRTGRSSVPELDVNQAELNQNGDLRFDANAEQLQLKPMTMEINAVLEGARLQVASLQERFDQEPNSDAALALVRQIERVKVDAELDILRVQVRYARAAGNEELAQKIEADLTQMTTPRPRRQPIDRPASDAGNR